MVRPQMTAILFFKCVFIIVSYCRRMRISVMPSLQRWKYKFLMKQKIVTVKLLERWNPATQNNLNVM